MSDRIKRAHEFAKAAHGDQKRKFTREPYMVHLEETAQLLHEVTDGKADIDMYVAAVLHDVVEDTDTTLQEVGQEFGGEVMSLVEELTIDEKEKEKEGKKPYLSRKINAMSDKAFMIKLCDRFSNVSGLDRREIPRDFVKWYVKETEYIIKHLDRVIDQHAEFVLNKIAQMMAYLRLNRNING